MAGSPPPLPASLADCSEAMCSALRQLQEGYTAAQGAVVRLQEEKAALKADACHMVEQLYGELHSSQDCVARLTVEVEHLRALQSELADAAAAEAEECRAGAEMARASEAAALRRAAALETELAALQQAQHIMEVERQDGRARSLVEQEGLASQVDVLEAQLAAAKAGAAAQQQVAELWQRKHASLEGQLEEALAALAAEQAEREKAQEDREEWRQRAQAAQADAGAFRRAAAESLQDLSELCSILKTAQVAMAADGSSKPAFLQALTLIQLSLLRVAKTAESALSAVNGKVGGTASGGGSSTASDWGQRQSRTGDILVGQQLHQHVQSLLLPPVEATSDGKKGDLLDQAELLQPQQGEGGTRKEWPGAVLHCSSPAGVALTLSAVDRRCQEEEGQEEGVANLEEDSGQQPEPQAPVLRVVQAAACRPASLGEADVKMGSAGLNEKLQADGGTAGDQRPSSFIQAFRARHGRAARAVLAASCSPPMSPQQAPPAAPGKSKGPVLPQVQQSGLTTVDSGSVEVASGFASSRQLSEGKNKAITVFPQEPAALALNGGGSSGLSMRGNSPAHRHAPVIASPLGGPSATRDSLMACIMAVEDELATLDMRHATLLQQSARLREAKALPGDVSLELEREEVAGIVHSVREAMQRKGDQLRQLRQFWDIMVQTR